MNVIDFKELEHEINKTEFASCLGFTFKELETLETVEDVQEFLQERIAEYDVIYCYDACKFLLENDSSLNECLSLASDCGYELTNINSELLATLLIQQYMNEDLTDVMNGFYMSEEGE